jgi:hypothetical protein
MIIPRRFVLVFLFTVLLLVYLPLLVGSYGFMDDYYDLYAYGSHDERLWACKRLIAFGRVAAVPISTLSFSYLRGIADLYYVRLSGVFAIAGIAWLLFRQLTRVGWDSTQSAFLSLILCTTPPFQVFAAWAATAQYAISAVISGAAFEASDSAFNERRRLRLLALVVIACAAEVVALTIAQSVGLFFVVFATIACFAPGIPLRHRIRRFCWNLGILFISLLVAFAIDRIGVALYGPLMKGDLARTKVTFDVWGKMSWFFRSPLMNALNLHHFPASSRISAGAAIPIGLGLFAYFKGTFRQRTVEFLVALFILPLSYVANLVTSENWSSYRTQAALTSVIILYAFFALHGSLGRVVKSVVLTGVIGALSLVCCVTASTNVLVYFVIPQSIELALARDQVRQADLNAIRGFYIWCSSATDSVAPVVMYDEFGFPTSANWGNFRAEVFLLLDEEGFDYRRFSLEFAKGSGDPMIKPRRDIAVIDMRKLAGYQSRPALVLPPVGEQPYPLF